jgi:hypothetical protein
MQNEPEETSSIVEDFKDSLNRNMPEDTQVEGAYEVPTNEEPGQVEQPQEVQQPLLVPPADMRQEERDAFLNPTPQNAHILQQYVNRRSYETRADYQRRQQEIEDARKVVNPLVDVVKRYEADYIKRNLNIYDVARRAIEWDRAISTDPVNSAIQWLETYGLTPQDLMQNQQPGQAAPQAQPSTTQYLTREEAEAIADERLQAAMDSHKQNAVAQYNEMLVQSFKNTKPVFKDPETGSQVEQDMIPIVQALGATGKYSSPEEILETAYNYVINGNPNYSGLAQKMAAGSRVQQQQQVAQQAKAAARSISGSPGTGTPRVKGLSFKENLERRLTGE